MLVHCNDLHPFRIFKLNWAIIQVESETALITHDFGRQVKVTGFDWTKSTNAETVTGALGFVDLTTGDRFMLAVHQAILVPKMMANLLGLMQQRDNDILVNDEPKHMVLTLTRPPLHHNF